MTASTRYSPQPAPASPVPRLAGGRIRLGLQWLTNPYGLLDRAAASVGHTFRARLPVLGEALFTGEPHLLRELMMSRDFDAGKTIGALRALLGERSLIMLHGQKHAARQQQVAALFRGSAAHAYERWMVEQVRGEVAHLDRSRPFSAYDLVQRVSLRAILAAFFGVRVAEEGRAEKLVQRFLNSFHSALVLFVRPLRVDAGPLSPWGRAMWNREQLCQFIRERIGSQGNCLEPTMLAQLLEAAAEDRWDEQDIVEEILSLLLFGHDTGAAAMAWTLAHLFLHPEAAATAEREARDWQRREACDVESLPWVRACVSESMRLAPVVVHLSRRAVRDTCLGSIPLARGDLVLPCSYLAHHHPDVFDRPHEFRPERFLHGQRYDGAYFPFGFGSRTCVGKPFVMRQMPLLIAALLANCSLRLPAGYTPHATRRLVLVVPRGGTLLEFRDSARCSARA